MNIDKNKLKALSGIDDRSLESLIRQVVIAAGGTDAQARSAVSAAPMIRKKLKTAGDAEIDQMINMVGKDKAEEVLEGLGLIKK